jgi:hypothetical protein
MKLSLTNVLTAVTLTAVIAAVVAGLLVIGIMVATDLYWTRHSRLPASLDDLGAEPGLRISTADPKNSETYGYQLLDSIHYEVCASFERESGEISRNPARDLWTHGTGLQCFQLEAKELEPSPR